ncbi:alpha/beta-hydrolase [Acaromyces ingoldii]|uniref:Alpha/beta-hydrolase n=1 Tax=Acaromyces ingoldii TaxID=215250 RepID=A0A316YBQ9_9BASI|nr:alpha/beta-hydrolase [Acaromyces ingoldii]PWN86732.1 alpha/beta-hydrolase [Acaromyces ingoldii]
MNNSRFLRRLVVPELKDAVQNFPKFDTQTHPAQGIRLFKAPPNDVLFGGLDVTEVNLPRADGEGSLSLMVVKESVSGLEPRNIVLVVHGGGLLTGHPRDDGAIIRAFARAGYSVVSPDYRLSPENPPPAPILDVLAAWNYIEKLLCPETRDLQRLTKSIAIYGTSSGAGLVASAVLSRAAETGKERMPCRVVVLDAPDIGGTYHPIQGVSDPEFLWTARNIAQSHSWSLDQPSLSSLSPKDYLLPRHVNEVPQAWLNDHSEDIPLHVIGLHGGDSLALQGLEYTAKLLEAGVPVESRLFAGAPHVPQTFFPGSKIAEEVVQFYVNSIHCAFNDVLPS